MTALADLEPGAWATLRGLLDRALELDPEARRRWLAGLGGEFAALRPRLCALLAHERRPRLPLDALPAFETTQFAGLPPESHVAERQAGDQVGPYCLLRELGGGGMATVWLAGHGEQRTRTVALKLPKGGRHRDWLAARMAHERAICERLDHPHIARLLDAGTAADGQPYLAFEPVRGEHIDAWCRRRASGDDARLRLFLQVARAVSHAHAKRVVHRDLKPENIVVTEAGTAKLLDFGIAEVLDDPLDDPRDERLDGAPGDRSDRAAGAARPGRNALTPDYAAPEQLRGEPPGIAADVYSLGVVLFELLAGCRPHPLNRGEDASWQAAIRSAPVQRPEEAVGNARPGGQLRGPLDAIVRRALAQSPAARYASVEALASEVARQAAAMRGRGRGIGARAP